MPPINLVNLNPFKKRREKPAIKLPVPPKTPIVPSTSWLQMLAGFVYSANEYVQKAWDIIYPAEWRSYQPVDDVDRRIVAELKLKAQKRNDFDLSALKRKSIIRNNHQDDIARVKTKNDICKSWEKQEIKFLDDKFESLSAINPGPEIDLIQLKIPGWEVNPGDSQFRGTKELCRNLQCSDSNLISPISSNVDTRVRFDDSNFFINQLQELEGEKQDCLRENIYLSNQYRELRNSIELQAHQQQFQGQNNNYLAIENGRNKIGYETPTVYSNSQPKAGFYQPIGQIEENESFAELLLHIGFFPTVFLDPESWPWETLLKNTRPNRLARWVMFLFALYIWLKLINTLFSAAKGLIRDLEKPLHTKKAEEPKPKAKEYFKKRKIRFFGWGQGNEKEEETRSKTKVILHSIWDNLMSNLRGGAIEESFVSLKPEEVLVQIDPIFTLIKIEKLQRKLRKKYSVKELGKGPIQRISMVTNELRNKPVLASIVLAIVLINQDLGKPFSRTHIIRSNQTTQSPSKIFEQISELTETKRSSQHIEVGDSILSFTSSKEENLERVKFSDDLENSNQIENGNDQVKDPAKPRVKKPLKRRAKMVRFSDLAPLDSHQFDDILTEGNFIRTPKVRIPLQTNRYNK